MKKIFFLFAICLLITAPVFLASASYTLETEYPAIAGASPTLGLVEYIRYIYLFGLSIVGLAAFGVMVYGGIQYMLSGANMGSQAEAKKWMSGAIYGLILAMASYLIIYTINPTLVSITAPKPEPLKPAAQQAQPGIIYSRAGEACSHDGSLPCATGLICNKNDVCTADPNYKKPLTPAEQQQLSRSECHLIDLHGRSCAAVIGSGAESDWTQYSGNDMIKWCQLSQSQISNIRYEVCCCRLKPATP